MKLFAQLRKIDEEKRMVFGRIAQEVVDKSGEIMDYEKSKPFFKSWSDEMSKDSGGKNLGNVRAMHGKVAAGLVKLMDFVDPEQAIDVGAYIADDNEWQKCLAGVYTGFSIGGSYGDKTVEKMDGRDVTRYVAKPNEVSLVDRPCIPTAKFFEVQKADGSLAKVEFQAPAEEDLGKTEEATIEGTPEQIDEMVKLMNEQGLNVSAVTEMIKAWNFETKKKKDEKKKPGEEGSAEEEAAESKGEAAAEGDEAAKAEVAGKVDTFVKSLGFDETNSTPEQLAELQKDATSVIDTLAKIGARNSKSDQSKIQTVHDHAVALGAACAAAKAEPAADLTKDAPAGDLQKAIDTALAPLNKALAEAQEKITKLEAQPAPARIVLRAFSKADDAGSGGAGKSSVQPTPVVDSAGEQHDAAGLIKSLHQQGGAPLAFEKRS